MQFLIFIAIASAALCSAAFGAPPPDNWVSPWYCHGLDCPPFTNITVDGGIQVRTYKDLLWVSTEVMETNINRAGSIGFDRLFAYISGENVAGIPIDMTAPVLNKVIPGAGPNCNSTFIVSFFTPYDYQTAAGPPAPTSPEVYIQTIPPLYVAVSEFSGYASNDEIIARTAALEKEISTSSDITLDSNAGDSWYFASYDPPFRVSNRHNEVWVPVVNK
jgi:hypothetical protein